MRTLTPTVGRERVISAVRELVADNRLVSIVGLGGVGKSRVAAEISELVANDGEADVAWVDLSQDAEIALTLARALHVSDQVGRDATAVAIDAIGNQKLFVVFDGCDSHANQAGTLAAGLLRACPGVRVLATSRVPLRVVGEAMFRLTGLAVEVGEEETGLAPAVQLFVDAARRVGHDVPTTELEPIVAICRRLEGLPLAIELAAGQLRVLSVLDLTERIGRRIGDEDGAEAVTSPWTTVKDIIESSYELLSGSGQRVYRSLGVFRSALVADVEAVWEGTDERPDVVSALAELVDASLVESPSSASRLHMADVVREHAAAQLELTGENDYWARKHAVRFAENSLAEYSALIGARQQAHLSQFDFDHDNFRTALRWAVAHDAAIAERLAAGLGRYWSRRGLHEEARRVLGQVVELPVTDPSARATMLGTLGFLTFLAGDDRGATRLAQEQLRVADQLSEGDLSEVSCAQARLTLADIDWHHGRTTDAHRRLASALEDLGPRQHAIAVYLLRVLGLMQIRIGGAPESSLIEHLVWWADERGHPAAAAARSELLGVRALWRGESDEAGRHLAEATTVLRQGGLQYDLARVLISSASAALMGGRRGDAERLAGEALGYAESSGARTALAQALYVLGEVELDGGDLTLASQRISRGVRTANRAPDLPSVEQGMSSLAASAHARSDWVGATMFDGAAEALRSELGLAEPMARRARTEEERLARRRVLGDESYATALEDGKRSDRVALIESAQL